MGDFNKAFAFTIGEEGGYVNNVADPGGATNFGITIATLSAYRGAQCSNEDVQDLTLEEAQDIYRQNYWNIILGDKLPNAIAMATFDGAVNSGTEQSVKWLQRALGTIVDGVVGPNTVRLCISCDILTIANAAIDRRLTFLQTLPEWNVFGDGWSNRIAALRHAIET
jgi:lysozyme family protein